MKDYYYILGIESTATLAEIKKAYRKLSVKFHPDKNKGDQFFEKRFKEIQEAYDTLSNKDKRINYDSKFKKQNFKSYYQKSDSDANKGEIISFDVSRKSVSHNEEITFFWATKNISKVELSCFKEQLPPTGKKTLKINALESKELIITLNAYDSYNIKISKSIKVNYIKNPNPKREVNRKKIENKGQSKQEKSSLNFKPLLAILIPILLLTLGFAYYNESRDSKAETEKFSNNNQEKNNESSEPVFKQTLKEQLKSYDASYELDNGNYIVNKGGSWGGGPAGYRNVGGKWGVINKDQKLVIPLKYDDIKHFYPNNLLWCKKDEKYILFDLDGNQKNQLTFDDKTYADEQEGVSIVQINDFWGAIDSTGNLIVPAIYERETLISHSIEYKNFNSLSSSPIKNDVRNISHGQSPYSYCFGSKNECSEGCSKISIKASYNSNVIVLIKKNDGVFRNAFISKGRTFEFNLPNGTYQTFFYYGSDWNNEKYMKETICGSLYGGFNEDEHFGKDKPQYLNNNILTYELVLQQNGNFSTKSSNLNEIF